jgi:hypothetical protein
MDADLFVTVLSAYLAFHLLFCGIFKTTFLN